MTRRKTRRRGGRRRTRRRKDRDKNLKRVIAQYRRHRIAHGDKRFKAVKKSNKRGEKPRSTRRARPHERAARRRWAKWLARRRRRTRRRRKQKGGQCVMWWLDGSGPYCDVPPGDFPSPPGTDPGPAVCC